MNMQKHISKLKLKYDLKIDNDHYPLAEALLGVCMRDKGEIDTALIHFLNVANTLNKDSSLANFRSYAFYLIAEIHMQINEVDIAGTHYKKALKIAQKVDHKTTVFRSLIGLGVWHQQKKTIRKVSDFLSKH